MENTIKACLLINGTQLIGEVHEKEVEGERRYIFRDPFIYFLQEISAIDPNDPFKERPAPLLMMRSFVIAGHVGKPDNEVEFKEDRIMCWFPEIPESLFKTYCTASGRKMILQTGIMPGDVDKMKRGGLN